MQDQTEDVQGPTCRVGRHSSRDILPVLLVLVALACSAPLWAQSMQDFTKIYDSYLAAVKAGSYSQASPYLSKEVRDEVPTPEAQTRYIEMVKTLVPIRYETEFLNLSKDGQSADVTIIATIAVPEEIQKQENLPPTQRTEIILKFVKVAGQWKMGPPLLLADPDKREKPKDLNMGARADYAEGANTEVGGVILRSEKQTAGTVYVLRLSDQEIAVFVPAAKVSSAFVPGSILVVHGGENKNDKLKLWAEDASLYQETAK